MGLLKNRGRNKQKNKQNNRASGAAAIALAYNDFDDSSSSSAEDNNNNKDQNNEEEEGGESDLLADRSAALRSIREDGAAAADEEGEDEEEGAGDGDESTVQTRETDVFLRYADPTVLEDGMSTVAPAEEANGGTGAGTGVNDTADGNKEGELHRQAIQEEVVEEEDTTTRSSTGRSHESSTTNSSVVSGSLISSLASGGVSKLGGMSPPKAEAHKHHHHRSSSGGGHRHVVTCSFSPRVVGPVPDWARDDDDDDEEESSDGGRDDHNHHTTKKKPAKLNRRSTSAGSASTETRKRNRTLTAVAMSMLFLGLCAVVLGVAYGMGLMGGDTANGEKSSAGANGAQACARTGLCGDVDDGGESEDGGNPVETDPVVPIDDSTAMMVPTDRPTSPPFDATDGACAANGSKSQSCGAHNPDHPARCCPGLYCADKVCTDPNPTSSSEGETQKMEDDIKKDDETKPTTTGTTSSAPASSDTVEPTLEPEPTARPTSAAPTKPPTPNMWISQPTAELTAEGIVPPPGHFTYDPDDAVYGPSSWSNPQYAATTSITLDGKEFGDTTKLAEMGSDELDGLKIVPAEQASAEYKFWSRHAWSIDPNRKAAITDNACDGGFDARAEQSPIDIYVQSGDIDETGEETGIPGSVVEPRCFEHHEIRIKPGQFSLGDERVRKEILPSQLRLTYPDPEFEADGKTLAATSKLPTADFPHGWGGNMEALRVDVKIPSEHWLNGMEYVAEYQLYHLHHKKKRAPVISIMMDFHPLDKPNEHFQLALDEWQAVWQKDYLECELRERKERRATETLMEKVKSWVAPASKQEELRQSTILDEPAEELEGLRRNLRAARKMQEEATFAWDPYKKDEIMRSIHFFAYSGSLTEPPCTEFVDWRILDTPMLISRRQLFQMKTLLFKHRSVEGGCRPSSNHHMGSVARRPLQPLNRRQVYRCSCRDFLSDEDRDEILALDGMTEANATYTPKCSKREFRLAEKKRDWLHRPEEEL